MTDERQKKTTDEYRNNWDAIFKKSQTKQQDNKQPKEEEQND